MKPVTANYEDLFYKMPNQKIYKSIITNKIRIFPGDLTGSPDDFFLRNYLKCWEFF